MAEKYGVIPKKFTKAWWPYFWMYYKWHTIAVVVACILIGTTIYQKVTAPKYDTTITYAGEGFVSEEQAETLTKEITPLCVDVNENGEKLAAFQQLNFSEEVQDPQYNMAMQMKLQLALSEDETYIFILDRAFADAYMSDESQGSVFAPLDDWLKADVPEDKKIGAGGIYRAVSLENNKFLEKCGIDTKDKCLIIRFYPRKDQEEQIPGYKGAIELANNILSYK